MPNTDKRKKEKNQNYLVQSNFKKYITKTKMKKIAAFQLMQSGTNCFLDPFTFPLKQLKRI